MEIIDFNGDIRFICFGFFFGRNEDKKDDQLVINIMIDIVGEIIDFELLIIKKGKR